MGANSEAAKPAKSAAHPLLRGYLEHLSNERRLSRHTVENYARDIAALLALAGGVQLKHVDVQQVRRHVAQLHARGLDGRTLARMLSAWRGFFNYLARDHGYTQNPCVGIRAPRAAKRLPHALSPDEAARLMEITAADPLAVRDKAIMELLYSSGLRLSELTGLEQDDVNVRDATVRVTGKGAKTRVVPVGKFALAALEVWLPARVSSHARARRRCSSAGTAAPWARARCRRGSSSGRSNWGWRIKFIRTPCGIRLLRTCCSRAGTCARCRRCWGTRASRRRRCIRIWTFSIWPRPTTRRIRARKGKAETPIHTRTRNAMYNKSKRIVVAIDGSSTSRRALREAVKLAKERRSALRIVHVVDLINVNVETPYNLTEYEASVRKTGDQILKRAAAIADKAGVEANTRLLEVRQFRDRIANEIAREAKDWQADLIVIGTHGRRGFSHLFLGSVAESVMRIAPTSVLLIRSK